MKTKPVLGTCEDKFIGHIPHSKNTYCANWKPLPTQEKEKNK